LAIYRALFSAFIFANFFLACARAKSGDDLCTVSYPIFSSEPNARGALSFGTASFFASSAKIFFSSGDSSIFSKTCGVLFFTTVFFWIFFYFGLNKSDSFLGMCSWFLNSILTCCSSRAYEVSLLYWSKSTKASIWPQVSVLSSTIINYFSLIPCMASPIDKRDLSSIDLIASPIVTISFSCRRMASAIP